MIEVFRCKSIPGSRRHISVETRTTTVLWSYLDPGLGSRLHHFDEVIIIDFEVLREELQRCHMTLAVHNTD